MDPLDEKVTGNEFSQNEKKKGFGGEKIDRKENRKYSQNVEKLLKRSKSCFNGKNLPKRSKSSGYFEEYLLKMILKGR